MQLARRHDDLAAMMGLMRDEVGHHMPYLELQVAPRVGLGWRYAATLTATQLQEGGESRDRSSGARRRAVGA